MEEVWTHSWLLASVFKNTLVNVPSLFFALASCGEGQLDDFAGFWVQLGNAGKEVEPGGGVVAQKKFGPTCSC